MSASVVVTRNDLPQIPGRLQAASADILNAGVLKIAERADPNTPVDTGHLINAKQFTMASPGSLSAQLHYTAEYAAHQELGTVRGVTPKLFATTAAEQTTPEVIQAFRGLEGRIT